MQIYGLDKTTLLDYPGHVAAAVFTGGCNFRCPFCHNAELVMDPEGQPQIPEQEVLEFLRKRRGVLEGVCITGGEPTLQPDLSQFLREIKNLGYLVKLDTNGYRPEALWLLLQDGLTDYVAMDIKSSRNNYEKAAGIGRVDLSLIEESIAMIRSSGLPYEFRTTVARGLHTAGDFEQIGSWLEGSRAYYLQAYRDDENVMLPGYEAFGRAEMEQFAAIVRRYIRKVELRGVD